MILSRSKTNDKTKETVIFLKRNNSSSKTVSKLSRSIFSYAISPLLPIYFFLLYFRKRARRRLINDRKSSFPRLVFIDGDEAFSEYHYDVITRSVSPCKRSFHPSSLWEGDEYIVSICIPIFLPVYFLSSFMWP